MKTITVLFGALILALMNGCSVIEDQYADSRANPASAGDLVRNETFEKVNLIALIDPDTHVSLGNDNLKNGITGECLKSIKKDSGIDSECVDQYRIALEKSIYNFYNATPRKANRALENRRNQIQDRLLAVSESRCNYYKSYLRLTETKTNFYFGAATTVLGGAGAIVNGKQAAQTLAGLAGISSGLRSEWNQEYLSNLTVEVVASGIDVARKEILQGIEKKRADSDIGTYTLEAAIQDAFEYHGACSIITGITAADVALESYDNPGLVMFEKVYRHEKLLQDIKSAENYSDLPAESFSYFYSRENTTEEKTSNDDLSLKRLSFIDEAITKVQTYKDEIDKKLDENSQVSDESKTSHKAKNQAAAEKIRETLTNLRQQLNDNVGIILSGNIPADNIGKLKKDKAKYDANYTIQLAESKFESYSNIADRIKSLLSEKEAQPDEIKKAFEEASLLFSEPSS